MTAEDIHRLEEAERDVLVGADIADVVAMTSANRRLHFAVLDACAFPRLVWLIHLLWDAIEVYRSVCYNEAHNREMVDSEHRALVAAVKTATPPPLMVLTEHSEHAIEALRPALDR